MRPARYALVPAALAGLAAVAGPPGPAARIPVIGRVPAQRLARAELSKPIYHQHPPLLTQILNAVINWLDKLLSAGRLAPGGWWSVAGLACVAVILITIVAVRVGPLARSRRMPSRSAPLRQTKTARDHRDAAAFLAQAGDYAGAICESLRAVAAELDERAVLVPRAGRTADELAREAGQAMPAFAAGLRDGAWLFDEVMYGKRPGTLAGYERLRALDAEVSAAAGRRARASTPAGAVVAGGRAG